MRRIVSGGKEIDGCSTCGATWFDFGEVRELTEGRLSASPEGGTGPGGKPREWSPPKEKASTRISRMRAAAPSPHCPRCDGFLQAVDFQATGIPVFRCPSCEGILAPAESSAEISARFRFLREHGAQYAALGETLAAETKRRMETAYGPAPVPAREGMAIPLPVVVPLADDGPEPGSRPLVTYVLIGISVFLYILRQAQGGHLTLPGGLEGLPSGTGFAGIPRQSLLFAPVFHAGILPLAVGSIFLFVLGDNVEDRIGKIPYFLFYLFCGAVAGAAHVLWGKIGSPAATGSAGAVAGVLGAYLVFFPNVSLRVYGMGRIVRLPAYLFACAWVVAVFFLAWNTGPVEEFLYPGAYSLAGNMAGFGAGILGAILWIFCEDSAGSETKNS